VLTASKDTTARLWEVESGNLALADFEKDAIRADFLRRYSLGRLPNDPKLRQRAAEFLRQQAKTAVARLREELGKTPQS
jgi:hypothetical protein